MDNPTDFLAPGTLVTAFAIATFGGFIKGAVGFALPLILVSGLTTIMDPLLAIAGLVVPTVATNLVQAMRAGPADAWSAVRDFWKFILAACGMVLVVTQILPKISPTAMYLVIGVPVLGLSLIQLAGVRFRVSPERRPVTDPAVGLMAGIIGGVAGAAGPPTVLYLLALNVERARQLTIQGVVYGLAAISLLLGHLNSGLLNRETLPFSAALLVPVGIGMALGLRLGDRLDPVRFRRLTLVILGITGANLIRRGIMG